MLILLALDLVVSLVSWLLDLVSGFFSSFQLTSIVDPIVDIVNYFTTDIVPGAITLIRSFFGPAWDTVIVGINFYLLLGGILVSYVALRALFWVISLFRKLPFVG